MHHSFRLVLTLGAALALLPGCGGSEAQAPSGFAINGVWRGGVGNGSEIIQLTMTLAEAAGAVTGTGTISGNLHPCDLTINGTRDAMTVALSLHCTGYIPVSFAGHEQGDTTIVGHLSGSGIPPTEFDLFKQ